MDDIFISLCDGDIFLNARRNAIVTLALTGICNRLLEVPSSRTARA